MKFTIKRKDAAEAIKKCLAVTGRGTTLPILSCIRIDAKDGEVTMTASDLDRWMVCRVPAEVEKDGSAAMSGRILSGIFSAGEEAAVSVDAKLKATINCGGSQFRFSVLKGDEMPAVPECKSKETLVLTADAWLDASKAVAWAASTNISRMNIGGTLLEHDGHELSFVATDGTRLCKTQADSTGKLAFPITIPSGTMSVIDMIADGGDMHIAATDGMLSAVCGSVTVVSRLIVDSYPNYRAVIPKWNSKTTKIKIPAKEFVEKLDRIALMNGVNNPAAILDISPGTIAVTARSSDDDATASIDVEVSGKDQRIAVSNVMLGHPFRKWGADELEMEVHDEMSPCLLRSGRNLCVVMPMRIQ